MHAMATDNNSNSELSSKICHFPNSLLCNYIFFSFLAASKPAVQLESRALHQRCASAVLAMQLPRSFSGQTPVRPCGAAASQRNLLTSVFNSQ